MKMTIDGTVTVMENLSEEEWRIYLEEMGRNAILQRLTSIDERLTDIESLIEFKETKETLRVATQITDDQILKLKVSGADRDGEPASIGALSASVDDTSVASAAIDPADPATIIVTPLPVAAGGSAIRTVNVTITDTTSGLVSAPYAIEIDPGLETALVITPTVEAAPAVAA